MKKTMMQIALALVMLPALAHADDLADAVKAWEQRDFSKAYQGFSKLAAAGNAQAQLMLGEMYGFGEGVPEDAAKAREWLQKAAAGGNAEAASSLQLVQQRGQRRAEIARLLDAGQARAPTLAAAGCVGPRFPEVSTTQGEIKAVADSMNGYRACYDKYIDQLAARKVPDDLAMLMSVTELDRARALNNEVVSNASKAALAEASTVLAANDAWFSRTKAYATANNLTLATEAQRRQRELDASNETIRAFRDAAAARIQAQQQRK